MQDQLSWWRRAATKIFRFLWKSMAILLVVFVGLAAFRMVVLSPLGPWTSVEVPLPEGYGKVTYGEVGGFFIFGIDRRIEIDFRDGRHMSFYMMNDLGNVDTLYFKWQRARDGRGPFLLLLDWMGATWVNLKELCLEDTNNPDDIDSSDRCPSEHLPPTVLWDYFAKVEDTYEDGESVLTYTPETRWSPERLTVNNYIWPPEPLPDPNWTFIGFDRSVYWLGRGSGSWVILQHRDGHRMAVPAGSEQEGEYLLGAFRARLFWYSARDGQGPYLRVGDWNGTLADLGKREVYFLFQRGLRHPASQPPPPRVPSGMVPYAALQFEGYGSYWVRGDFHHTTDAGHEVTLQPLPTALLEGEGLLLGTLHLFPMTFYRLWE